MAATIQEFIWEVNSPFSEDVNYNTLITRYEDGKEQRRQKWSAPKRVFSISLRGRTRDIFTQVWNFYNSRNGAFDTFYFVNPNETPVNNENFGTGNGSATVFTLTNSPLPSGEPSIVKVAAVTKTEGTDYTVNRTTGAITFTAAPASGNAITATYDFARIVRFAEDKLNREMFSYQLYNGNLKLIEVL